MNQTTTSHQQTEDIVSANSDAAFAERMRYRLNDMIANPYSFLPSYQARYEKLLQYAQTLTPHQAYAMTMLLGKDSARLYPDMPNTAELEFPRVNAVDATSQVGWYYFAGTCQAKDGTEYGILCMFFRYSLLPPPIARQFGLTDTENQIVDLQLAVSVGGGKFFQVDPTVTAGTSGNIRISDKLCLVTENGSVESAGDEPFPMRLQARGVDYNDPENPVEISIDFTFTSARNYLPQGLDGAMPLVGGVGTRYYSIPGLVLDGAASNLVVDSTPVPLEGGTFWFDHQWGQGLAPSGSPRHESMRAAANLGKQVGTGWDFFVANFDGPYSMTLNSIHTAESVAFVNQTGPNPPGNLVAPVVGKYLDPYGTLFNISGELTVTDWRKTDHTPNLEKYSNVGTWVPHGWKFQIQEGVVPERLRSFRMEPITDDAQAIFFGNGAQYVEAAVRIIDANNAMAGRGYAEAVGYINTLHVILDLAGLPVNPEILALFTAQQPTPAMVVESILYLLRPEVKQELDRLMKCGSFPPAPRPTDCGGNSPAPGNGNDMAGQTEEALNQIAQLLRDYNRHSL